MENVLFCHAPVVAVFLEVSLILIFWWTGGCAHWSTRRVTDKKYTLLSIRYLLYSRKWEDIYKMNLKENLPLIHFLMKEVEYNKPPSLGENASSIQYIVQRNVSHPLIERCSNYEMLRCCPLWIHTPTVSSRHAGVGESRSSKWRPVLSLFNRTLKEWGSSLNSHTNL